LSVLSPFAERTTGFLAYSGARAATRSKDVREGW
jgi:hypothetical protein